MIWTIAKREIAEAMVTGRVPLLFVLVVIVLGTGMLVMRNDYQARLDAYALVRPDGTEPVVAVPPSPLSVFARELDDAMGRRFQISAVGIQVGETQTSANPLFGAFPTPDWLFLFRVVLGLLAFLAGYDLICREKAQGTLKLLLAGGASRGQIAAGKLLGGWLALLVPVALAALLWLVLAGPLLSLYFRPGDGPAIATFLGLGAVYLTVCFSIAAALSALFHDQTTALVSAVLAWAVLVFVVPGSGALLARQLVPVRPAAVVESENKQAFGRHMVGVFDEIRSAGSIPGHVEMEIFHAGWDRIHAEQDRIGEQAAAEAARLTRVAETMGRLSPAGAFQNAAARVTGTSIHDELALRRRLVEHKNSMLPAAFAHATASGGSFGEFLPPARSLGGVMADRRADLAALALAAALSLLAFFTAVRGYDVR